MNDNAQMIRMWLSAEETTVFDNALVLMEHLYKTGTIKIRLRHLLNEESSLEISYFIDKTQQRKINIDNDNQGKTRRKQKDDTSSDDEEEESKSDKIKTTLSMADIADHRRQLTFCSVDLPENMAHRKILLNGQLNLLKLIENIYSTFIKLEMSGHPHYQLKNKHYKIHNETGERA